MRALNILVTESETFPLPRLEDLTMRVFRHIGAAYETGDADCWDAAHARAETALGPDAGTLLVARAAAIVRLIRAERLDFVFLPMPCRALSRDETALLHLLRESSVAPAPRAAARILDDIASIDLLAAAACALAGRPTYLVAPGILSGHGSIMPRVAALV